MLVGNSEAWRVIMEKAAAAVKGNRGRATDGEVPAATAELGKAVKTAKQQSAKKARDRTLEKKEERSKRSRISVG